MAACGTAILQETMRSSLFLHVVGGGALPACPRTGYKESVRSGICSDAEDMSLSRVRAYGQWVCSVIEKRALCCSRVSHENIGPACDYGNFVHAPPPWFARCSGQGAHWDPDVGGQVGVRGMGLHSPPGVRVWYECRAFSRPLLFTYALCGVEQKDELPSV